MTDPVALVIHFDDLRLIDHRPLSEARTKHDKVYGLTIIDPSWVVPSELGVAQMSGRRLAWRLAAVENLRRQYQDRGGDLLVRVGRPGEVIKELCRSLNISTIYGQAAKTPAAYAVRADIERCASDQTCHWIWNDVLFDPDVLPPMGDIPYSFTRFRRKVEKRLQCPEPLPGPDALDLPPVESGQIPTPSAFGVAAEPIDERSPIANLQPGEQGALKQLEDYMWRGHHVNHYKRTRNGMTEWNQSSKLSPYLALGCVSPRSVVSQLRRYEATHGANDSTYWLFFELLWREYFHFLAYSFDESLFRLSGLQGRLKSWHRDKNSFSDWVHGTTGWPFVDACMRELAASGYMSNRGRQNVASYFAKYRGLDWRWGARWFEHHLIDYDPCVNYGNWQYVAGIGTDLRDRMFNIRRQAEIYDGGGAFVRRWLPERAHLDTSELIAMNGSKGEQWRSRKGQGSPVGQPISAERITP